MTLRTLLVVHLALVASALIATPSIVFARQFEGGKVPIAIADSVQTGLEVPTFVGTTVPSDNRLRMAQNSIPSDKAPAGGGEKKNCPTGIRTKVITAMPPRNQELAHLQSMTVMIMAAKTKKS